MQLSNPEQAEFWNAEPGQNWVRHQADLDAISEQASDVLLDAAGPRVGEKVLDVGCGAGTSSFALARSVAPSGYVHGVDISAPLLACAAARRGELGIENVAFENADAQDHPFLSETFDLVASRFGLMFFSDPVAAFQNLRSALRSGGRIAFVAWAGPEHNPWFAWPNQVRNGAARLGGANASRRTGSNGLPGSRKGSKALGIGRLLSLRQPGGRDRSSPFRWSPGDTQTRHCGRSGGADCSGKERHGRGQGGNH